MHELEPVERSAATERGSSDPSVWGLSAAVLSLLALGLALYTLWQLPGVMRPPAPLTPAQVTFVGRLGFAVLAWWITTKTRKPENRRPWYRDWLLGLSLVLSFFVWPWTNG